MEIFMVRLSTIALALTTVGLAIAPIAAQAAPPITDARYVVADSQTSGTNVAEGIFIDRNKAVQVSAQRPVKPRIWISMGFGF
jgi:hypothetical protein